MFGEGQYTTKLCYSILGFGFVIIGLHVLEWYFDWPF